MNDHEFLLRECRKIVEGIGKTFAPFCEVILHDLTNPDSSIVMMEGNLTGRSVGSGTTSLGLARLTDPNFPDVLANYSNALPDGRSFKSTSIGLRNTQGEVVASLCINIDISMMQALQHGLHEFIRTPQHAPVRENLHATLPKLKEEILHLAAQWNCSPHSLTSQQKKDVLQKLEDQGFMQLRHAAATIAEILGISRMTVYNYTKKK